MKSILLTARVFLSFIIVIFLFHLPAISQHEGHTDMTSPADKKTPTPGSKENHSGHEDMDMTMDMTVPAGWADPNIVISPPPPLMGKQMGRVNTLDVPPLGYKMDGHVKVFTLIAQPVEVYFVEDEPPDKTMLKEFIYSMGEGHMEHNSPRKVKIWGYNGSSPGPTIECNEGDTIRVILKNELPEPTSIHWHGALVPNGQDGSAGLTQDAVLPGGTFTYEFTLYQSGTLLYHSGFNKMKQISYGLAGLLVVHPKKYPKKIDKEFAISLQEWAFLPGNENPDLVSMDFNWFTFNGKSAPSIDVLTVKQGERVRIRIGNFSMDNHPIHIHGYSWMVVGTEAGPIQESAQWPGNTVDIPPGSSRDVEFVAWNPGAWMFHCHKIHHIINAHADIPMGVMPHGGMFTVVKVIPKDPNGPWKFPGEEGLY